MAFCPACGKPVANQARFCVECGRPLDPAGSPPPAEEPAGEPSASRAPPAAEPTGPVSLPAPPPEEIAAGQGRRAQWRVPSAWLPAARIGLAAVAIGLGIQYALGAVMVLIQVLSGAGVDWGATLRAPLTVFLSLHGPVDGLGVWATGVGWVVLGFWLAGRRVRAHAGSPAPLAPALVVAVQSALIYTIPVLVLALVFEPEALPIDLTVYVAGSFFDPAAYGGWSPWLVATLGLLAALAGAVVSVAGPPVGSALRRRLPGALSAGWAGTRTLLGTAIPGVLGVVVIGAVVETVADGAGLTLGAAYLATLLLAAVAWGGLNVGAAFVVFSMRFFGGDGSVLLRGRPGWVFACIGIVVVAYLRGGYRAARECGPAPVGRIALAAASSGGLAAILLAIMTVLDTPTAPELAGPALGLGLLWSVVAVLGGLWQAGIRPRSLRSAPAVPAPPPSE